MYNNTTSDNREYISMDNRRKYTYDNNPTIDKLKINGVTYDIGSKTPQPYTIQTVAAEPGDVILAHVSEDLNLDTVNDIWRQLKVAFPNNDVLIANEYILKGLTIIKPATGKVNEHYRRETSDILDDWLRRNVEYTL